MLHEVLLALLGHTGSIFMQVVQTLEDINNLEEKPCQFQVNPNLPFLSQAEIDQLNKLVGLGAMFK
jgi:hypothetical protein